MGWTMGKGTYVNEFLQILIQVGQIILALLVLCDQRLLALQEFLTRLLEFLSFGMFVVDARNHKVIFTGFAMLGEEF
ncbi:hypothetical protein F1880_000678 [Penicillium rolfsii]|nr:hypothetical protein F1880_000678 [Penicillium rolfsii]